ncbi:MAG: DUF2752 domain-containing protein [Roseibacillus sp.]
MKWLWRQSARWTLISALLRERAVVFSLVIFSLVYLAFSLFEIPIWRCLWRMVTGWRCPGCGLTTGCKAFLRGQFAEGLAWNWFAPFVLLGLVLVPVVLALPREFRERVLLKMEAFERRTRLALMFVLLLVVQTFARLGGWA